MGELNPNPNPEVNSDDLCIIMSLCCGFTSLYIKCCDCIGCIGHSEFLCCHERVCAKQDQPWLTCSPLAEDNLICQLGLGCIAFGLKSPSTCFKSDMQFCCMYSKAALPCAEDIPAVCTLYGITCYPACCSCCRTMGSFQPREPRKPAAAK